MYSGTPKAKFELGTNIPLNKRKVGVPNRCSRIGEKLRQEATVKLDYWLMDVSEQTVVGAPKTCDVDCNKVFIKDAPENNLNGLLPSILVDLSNTKKCFEDAIIQVKQAPKSYAKIASEVTNAIAAILPIA